MAHENVASGAVYNTDGFTDDAVTFVQGKNLELVTGVALVSRIKQMNLTEQIGLFDLAVEGDYLTATCPSCGIKMRKMDRKNGSQFWRCPNFSRCRSQISISRE